MTIPPSNIPLKDIARAKQERDELKKKITPEELRRRMTAESLSVQNPQDNSASFAIDHQSPMVLSVMAIELYDKNPRQKDNENFEEIKQSIIATRGMQSTLNVTRRPGASNYMVGQGGNTRLKAQQDAYQEATDPALKEALSKITVVYKPWISESNVLMAHLVENMVRSDMCYWDSALGIMSLKKELEQEAGKVFSAREFSIKLNELGLPRSFSQISKYAFLVEHFHSLGSATQALSGLSVRQIQPAFSCHLKLAKHFSQNEQWILRRDETLSAIGKDWSEALFEVKRQREEQEQLVASDELPELELPKLDYENMVQQLDTALAGIIDKSADFVTRFRAACEQHPRMGMDELVAIASVTPTKKKERAKSQSNSPTPLFPEPAISSDDDNDNSLATQIEASSSRVLSAEPTAENLSLEQLRVAFLERARAFSLVAEVSDCFVESPALEAGFYAELPESPLDLSGERYRYGGWWVLATLSRQFKCFEKLPDTSKFKKVHAEEDNLDQYSFYMDSILGGVMPADELILWASEPQNPAHSLYIELLKLAMLLRQKNSSIFADVDAEES